jgi:phage terminase large subunit-like protein
MIARTQVAHFREFCERLVLDNGAHWRLEPFQVEIVKPILTGTRETWAILPQGNGKTTLIAGMALYHAAYTDQPWVPIGAASRDQAAILFGQAAGMVRQTPGLAKYFRVHEGYRRIVALKRGGRGIQVYAADANTGDGVIPTLAILDEGHRHPDLRLYRLWRGKLNKRGGQIIMISTAGEPGTEFEETRDRIRDMAGSRRRKGSHLCARGPSLVMNEWKVARASEVTDMRKVKAANPFSGITVETLKAEFESPTTDLGDWKRLACDIAARSTQAAVTDKEWDDAHDRDLDEIAEGERIDVGADVAWKHDTFALVPLWRGGRDDTHGAVTREYRLLGPARILTPPRDGSSMHPDMVKRAFELLNERNPIDAVVIDMERAEDVSAWLEDELAVTVIDRGQSNLAHAEDYENFMSGLRNGTLRHTGDPGLRRHVMHAIARTLPGGRRRFDRPSQSRAKRRQDERVIDALTAAGMVNTFALDTHRDIEPMVAWG